MKIVYVYGVQHDFKHFFIFLLCYMACEILVPLPGMDTASPVLEAWSPNPWATREVPTMWCFDTHMYCEIFTTSKLTYPSPHIVTVLGGG